jgi:hypothetical protein
VSLRRSFLAVRCRGRRMSASRSLRALKPPRQRPQGAYCGHAGVSP